MDRISNCNKKKKKFVYLVVHLISFKNKKNVAYKKYHSKKKN